MEDFSCGAAKRLGLVCDIGSRLVCRCSLARPLLFSLSLSLSLAADRAFTAMQIIATIACSVSVVLLSLAFFRPSVGVGGCSSPRSLAFVGGALMATYALFQLIAVVLGGTFKQELNSIGGLIELSVRGRLYPCKGVCNPKSRKVECI